MAVDFRLYLITDRKIATKPLPEAVRLALNGGVRAIQLREKDLPVRDLLALARELRTMTREFGARLFVNDRVDVAIAADADGVHLAHASMPAHAVRKIVPDDFLIVVSTHDLEEAWQAEAEGADFITFGPVFATPSKMSYGLPPGPEALEEAVRKVAIPVFGLGGIRQRSIDTVLAAGAFGISLISGILAADDIRQAAADMCRTIQGTLAGERQG